MNYNKISLIYFSATGTTRKIVSAVAAGTGMAEIKDIDITSASCPQMQFTAEELVVFGMPVYAGRIPSVAAEALQNCKGNGIPAIAVCVYGNREFDDALLELSDLVKGNGFQVISAGAFVAQHSIFPAVAQGRPDEKDLHLAMELGQATRKILEQAVTTEKNKEAVAAAASAKAGGVGDVLLSASLVIPGNRPYRIPGNVPLKPKATRKCTACGKCVKECPVQAIDKNNPRMTNKTVCISCAHCIAICPVKARKFTGILYWMVSRKFAKKCAARKESYLVLPK